jgi:RNA polymerase sigma-70 factor, ECF subfamily
MEALDEAALIELARNDPEAFAELYQRYLPRVYRYLYVRLGNQVDVEDITSQVFVEALEELRRNRYRETGCFPAWLFSIVRRRLADFYRRRAVTSVEDCPSLEPGLLDHIQLQDNVKRLAALLVRPSAEKQELLRLRFAAGLSFAEIAALENQSAAAVKMAVYRAVDWLREHWEAEDG